MSSSNIESILLHSLNQSSPVQGQIKINYRKIRPLDLESLAKQYEPTDDDVANQYNPFSVSEIQSFNPLYTDFFVLNESNYNRVGLNHTYYLEDAAFDRPYHVKSSPLLDPIHYLVGKYQNAKNLHVLPNLSNQDECFAKIVDKQNASYVDGFFSFLSSQLSHKYNMLNAIDFYGSHLAIQKVFKATVTDDLDYLHQSTYFMDHIGKGVRLCCGGSSNTFDDFTGIGSRANKKRLVLDEELDITDLDLTIDVLESGQFLQRNNSEVTSVGIEGLIRSDAQTVETPFEFHSQNHNRVDNSNIDVATVSCEYRKSENDDSSSDSDEDDPNYSSSCDSDSSDTKEELEYDLKDDKESKSGSESESGSSISSESSESEAYAYIENFPTNLIFLEKCDGTLDQLFMDQEIDEDRGSACLMQIIMSLIALQKAFHFTHNDLHTNNIMYINTNIQFLYYKYNNCFYRVPTYGKIFKIIDFGRAIYRFKNKTYCSDSFGPKGDAHSQYNTEPYFNEKRPRIEPNLSFDLCRLGTSIYDFIIQDENEPRDEFQDTIYRWCMDDNGKNIMYRRDGEERYPGFKLYKMIARNVHSHTPQEQLKYPIFAKFLMKPLDAAKLDESEVRQNGLNMDLIEREYV